MFVQVLEIKRKQGKISYRFLIKQTLRINGEHKTKNILVLGTFRKEYFDYEGLVTTFEKTMKDKIKISKEIPSEEMEKLTVQAYTKFNKYKSQFHSH